MDFLRFCFCQQEVVCCELCGCTCIGCEYCYPYFNRRYKQIINPIIIILILYMICLGLGKLISIIPIPNLGLSCNNIDANLFVLCSMAGLVSIFAILFVVGILGGIGHMIYDCCQYNIEKAQQDYKPEKI